MRSAKKEQPDLAYRKKARRRPPRKRSPRDDWLRKIVSENGPSSPPRGPFDREVSEIPSTNWPIPARAGREWKSRYQNLRARKAPTIHARATPPPPRPG